MKPLCDIVLLTWNHADLLKPCVERFLRHTDVPSRILIVDNASTDPDAIAYLKEVEGKSTELVRIEVVRRAHNDGFGQGMNDGMSRTSAPWICLANNDILVTEGWLSEMIRVAETHPKIGWLNPMSNQFDQTLKSPETPEKIAQRLSVHRGEWLENWSCVGFCVLMPRQVFEKVGLFAPEFGFMYFEDADYSLRVIQAGFLCGIAQGAYVYHHEGSTMKKNPAREALFAKSQERFFAKWNRIPSERIAWIQNRLNGVPEAEIRERIRKLANDDHKIWFFCTPQTASMAPSHYNVVPVQFPGWFFRWGLAWRLATKKKKFHRVIHA